MDKLESAASDADLTNCDRESIHIPGKIQSHGFLIALDGTLNITHCSDNIDEFLDLHAEQLLGKPVSDLEELLNTPTTDSLISQLIRTSMTVKGFTANNPYPVYVKKRYFNLVISRSAAFFVLEFEPEFSDLKTDLQQSIGSSISEILADSDLNQLLENTASQIKKIIGYDRVMIYQFHPDGHGEVVAEDRNTDLKSLLGLHYPASDIPKQARELYKINLVRLISNVHDEPAGILSMIESNLYPLDLTHVSLRAVSPIHIQYLKNMGVDSSFSISLIDKNELWGLIACHNYTPRFINYKEREGAKLIGQVLSSALSFRKNKEDGAKKYSLKIRVDELVRNLLREENLRDALVNQSTTILDAVDATGAVLIYDKQIHSLGHVPPQLLVLQLIDWLQLNSEGVLFHTNQLPKLFPQAIECKETGSGILSCRINRELEEYMIWFRPEVVDTIQWAGNPDKPALVDPLNMLRISPRTSFEAWTQEVQLTSAPWKQEDIDSAMQLREEVSFTISRKATELRILNERLKVAYEELTTFSYTISHDLRNPLSSINGFAQLLLSEPDMSPDELKFMHERILVNTQKMERMIKEVLAYSQAGVQPIRREEINLKSILEDLKQELMIGTKHPDLEITIGDTPSISGDHIMVTQIFSNVLGNAVKYSSKNPRPSVAVNGHKTDSGVQYLIQDNGIGIEEKDVKKIFDLFSRLDTAKEYEGSGVGLAIVKKLIQKHDGEIWVESSPGQGTSFYIEFKS